MNRISIRKAETLDEIKDGFNAIDRSFCPRLSDTVPEFEQYLNKISTLAEVFVAYFGEEIVGLIAYYANDYEKKTAFITLIAVAEPYKGSGLGQELMKLCIANVRSHGMVLVKLEVQKENSRAIQFYIKNGFRISGERSESSYEMIKEIYEPINITRSSLPPFDEYCEEIKELWDSRWLTNMGGKHRKLEKELKELLDVPNITLYTNGHLALEYAIQALDLHGEIITTPFTFASTTQAIVRSGCKPVFCDIEPEAYTMDPQKIESLVTEKTCAIMPVHVYGNLCDVDAIQAIADKYNLKVIYDAAHAFGVWHKGTNAANYGDISMFSFHATKVFHTIEGGCLTYQDDALSQKLDALKNFGLQGSEEALSIGGNAKMNEFQAAMGICNLRHLHEEIAKRGAVVNRYHERLANVKGIRLNSAQPDTKPNHAYFPVLFDGFKYTRDEVFEKLAAEGIAARKYFYPLTNSFACYHAMEGFHPDATPVAKHAASHILTLPLYSDLALSDVDRICGIILE